jgi:site-specific DNA-cytosine methylase
VGRVAHGVSDRTHRLKALGNSVIPHIPYYIAKSILEVEDA